MISRILQCFASYFFRGARLYTWYHFNIFFKCTSWLEHTRHGNDYRAT